MRVVSSGLVALWVCVAAACSPSVPGTDSTAEGEREEGEGEGEEGEGEGEGEGEAPRTCDDNSDCLGGELCDGGVCLEVCRDSSDCDNALTPICDLDRSRCVGCVGDGDCDSDEACIEQRCVFFCDDNVDCRGGEVCDLASGACRTAECVDDDGCRGGFLCDNGTCVSILPIVCEANSVTCDGDGVATCNPDGTGVDVVACGADETCTDGACAALVCEPNAFGCDDDSAAWVCDGTGTQRTELPCRADQYCSDGACRARVCTPNSVVCAGDSLVVCDALGASSTVEACADDPACADGFGCSCSVVEGRGTCVERVCSPGIGQCVGNGVRACNESGSGFSAVVDCGANDCIEGRCLNNTCVANNTVCSGDLLLTCEADGTGYRATTCAETCAGADGNAACVNQVCEPRTTRCDASGERVVSCNDRGTAETTTTCVDGYCQDGVCRAEVCTPNRARCTSSSTAAVCDSRGASERSVTCGADETCSNGVCTDTTCTPQCGARTCGTESTCGTSCGTCDADETCNASGQCVANTTSTHVLQIVTTWTDTDSLDFDTYLSRTPASDMCDLDTCYVGTCVVDDPLRPDWDGTGSASDGDPVGVFSGEGEESLTLTLPRTSQTYRLGLHYDSTSSADPQASVRVRVFLDDVEIDTASKVLRPDDLWDGTTITWSGTRLALVDSTRTQSDFACDPSPGSCNSDSECPASQFCNGNFLFAGVCVDGCRNDAGCGPNEVCDNGTCVATLGGGLGDTCTATADCRSGLSCGVFSGVCVERCEQNLCVLPGFFGCCELTAAENGTASCNNLGFCQ